MINYNWLVISTDLQENAALHCLVACFSHELRLNFNFKYKIEGATEKIKNHQRFLYWPRSIYT
jgi:hypothetical protein